MVRPIGGGPPPPEVPKTSNANVPPQLQEWQQDIGKAISLVRAGDYESLAAASFVLGRVEGQMLAYGYNPSSDPLGSIKQAADLISSVYGGTVPDPTKICNFLQNALNILKSPQSPQPINNTPNIKQWINALEQDRTNLLNSNKSDAYIRMFLNAIGIVQGQLELYPNDPLLQQASDRLTRAANDYSNKGNSAFDDMCQQVDDAIALLKAHQ